MSDGTQTIWYGELDAALSFVLEINNWLYWDGAPMHSVELVGLFARQGSLVVRLMAPGKTIDSVCGGEELAHAVAIAFLPFLESGKADDE